MYVCMYVYVYAYIHVHICVYVYKWQQVKREANSPAITVMLFDDEKSSFPGPQFTCFTSTKVQILTPLFAAWSAFWLSVMHNKSCQVLSLLALLVQTYEY